MLSNIYLVNLELDRCNGIKETEKRLPDIDTSESDRQDGDPLCKQIAVLGPERILFYFSTNMSLIYI